MRVMPSRRHWLRVVAVHTADRLDGVDAAEATGLPEEQVADLAAEDVHRIHEAVTEIRYRLSRIGGPRA